MRKADRTKKSAKQPRSFLLDYPYFEVQTQPELIDYTLFKTSEYYDHCIPKVRSYSDDDLSISVLGYSQHRTVLVELNDTTKNEDKALARFNRALSAAKSYASKPYHRVRHNCVFSVTTVLQALGIQAPYLADTIPFLLDTYLDHWSDDKGRIFEPRLIAINVKLDKKAIQHFLENPGTAGTPVLCCWLKHGISAKLVLSQVDDDPELASLVAESLFISVPNDTGKPCICLSYLGQRLPAETYLALLDLVFRECEANKSSAAFMHTYTRNCLREFFANPKAYAPLLEAIALDHKHSEHYARICREDKQLTDCFNRLHSKHGQPPLKIVKDRVITKLNLACQGGSTHGASASAGAGAGSSLPATKASTAADTGAKMTYKGAGIG